MINLGLGGRFDDLACAHASNGLSIIRHRQSLWIAHTADLRLTVAEITASGPDDDCPEALLSGIPAYCVTDWNGLDAAVNRSRGLLRLQKCQDALVELGFQVIRRMPLSQT